MPGNAHNAPVWQCGAQSRHTKQGEAQAEPRTKALPSAAPGADKKRRRAVTDAAFPRPTAYLAVENDVLAAAENGLPAHLVARRLWGEETIAEPSEAEPRAQPLRPDPRPRPAPSRCTRTCCTASRSAPWPQHFRKAALDFRYVTSCRQPALPL